MKRIWPDIKLPLLSATEAKLRQLGYRIAVAHDVSFKDMMGESKNKELVSARREFCIIAYQTIAGLSQRELAAFINRKASTINSLINNSSQYYKPKLKKYETLSKITGMETLD